MKIYISKILIIILMINALVPFSAFATSEMALYNRDEAVNLSWDLQSYNDSFYISISELHLLTISSDYSSPVLYMSNIDNNVTVYLESSIVILNGAKILYKNPLILINAQPYVSLELVAMIFSSMYEVDMQTNTIELWTKERYTEIINGVIKLPNGKTAPQGGVSLDVFVGVKKSVSSGGGIYYPIQDLPGFPGIVKPTIPRAATGTRYDYINRETILIPAGNNSVEFFLEAPEGSLGSRTYVGYIIDSEEYNETYAVPYYFFSNGIFSFEINDVQQRSISGSVTLPQAVAEDTSYTVYAHNSSYTYVCNSIIEAGQVTSGYLLKVKGGEEYTISIAFDKGKYMRSNYSEDVYVGASYNISGINFVAIPSNKITGTLILPDGFTPAGDIVANITMQSAQSPYYYLDTKAITIPYGNEFAQFELFDDMNVSNVIVYYKLSDYVDGLYIYGHYSGNGTVSRVQYADVLVFAGAVLHIPLLKTKEITVTVKLPDDETADADIYGRIYAVPSFSNNLSSFSVNGLSLFSEQSQSEILTAINDAKSIYEIEELISQNLGFLELYGYDALSSDQRLNVVKIVSQYKYSSIEDLTNRINNAIKAVKSSSTSGGGSSAGGGVSVSIPLLIEKDSNVATSTVTVADELNAEYKVIVSNISGSDKYYNQIYYNQNSSTVLEENATEIDAGTDNIEITLMKQNIVSGTIETNSDNISFGIYALYQDDRSIHKDIYNTMHRCFSNDIDNDYNYRIRVPDELEDYIFMIKPNYKSFLYYSQAGTTNTINSADIVTVNSNIDNINFTYEGFNPLLPLNITSIRQNVYSNYWDINIENISDFEKENIKINACFYDGNNRLQKVITDSIDVIGCNGFVFMQMRFDSAYSQAKTAKIYLWTENMQPLSDAYIFKNELSEDDIKDADVVFAVGSTTMYIDGEEHTLDVAPILLGGQMLVPMRAFAEALGWAVSWNSESQTAEFEYGGNVLAVVLNSTIAMYNGNEIELEVPPQLVNDRTLAPAGEIAKCFGYNVDWNSSSGILKISNA